MRLDKFLKISRLVKRRTLAKELCDKGRVTVNNRVAKAGHVVSVGDELKLTFAKKVIVVRIESVNPSARKEEVSQSFTVLKEDKAEKEEKTEIV